MDALIAFGKELGPVDLVEVAPTRILTKVCLQLTRHVRVPPATQPLILILALSCVRICLPARARVRVRVRVWVRVDVAFEVGFARSSPLTLS